MFIRKNIVLSGNYLIPNTTWHLRWDDEQETRNKTRESTKKLEEHDDGGVDLGVGRATNAQGKTKAIVEKANREGIERHRDTPQAIVKKVESVKTKIEQAKRRVSFRLTR